jgi:MtaA/CmuA family methyltransferase
MNSRQRVFAMMDGRPVDRLPLMPITMMFAADLIGRPYGEYVTDHRVLAAGQAAVAERFGLDYVSAISDPAREAADLGANVRFYPDQPPAIDETAALLADKGLLARLRVPVPAAGKRMGDRLLGVADLKKRAGDDLLVEGWVEGPCALAADLRGLNTLMMDFFDDDAFVRDLMAFAVDMELEFARAQLAAGADIIGIGDAAASLVGPQIYDTFVRPEEQRLISGIREAGGRVRLHICGNTRPLVKMLGGFGADIVDLDFMVPLADARAAMGPEQVLLGNLDPVRAIRDSHPAAIRAALAACRACAGPRYIVGAGCEICRDTPAENFMAMREYAESAAG